MRIERIELNKFRNYFHQQIEFNRDINIFLGANAQGKTNLLEAVYYLANAKSFKKARDRDIISFGEGAMTLEGKINKGEFYKNVSIQATNKSKEIRVNGVKYKTGKDLRSLFQVVVFTPEDLNIIKEGPAYRRELFDEIITSVDYSYKLTRADYDKVLFDRNRLLKNPRSKYFENELFAYDRQLSRLGFEICQKRARFVKLIDGFAENFHYKLSAGTEDLRLFYKPDIGCQNPEAYLEILKKSLKRDLDQKITSRGCHRDDVEIFIGKKPIKNFGSQGQQKSAIIDIKLAQVELIEKSTQDAPIILFDDCLSELDEDRAGFLLKNLGENQTIISATNTKSLEYVDKSKIRRIQEGRIVN